MEKKQYFYIINHSNSESEAFTPFKDTIASNYISKSVSNTLTIIKSDEDEASVDVYSKLIKGISEDQQKILSIFVVKMTSFYGILPNKVWDWLETISNEKLRITKP